MIAGGKSNLTYRLTDGQSTWALRRPPLGHVLPTAHDMGREFRVISALAPTQVPVAHPVAYCSDPEILGAPFYLTSFVDGAVLDRPGVAAGLDQPTAGRVCEQLVDTLVVLHDVDPKTVGLQDFGRPDGLPAATAQAVAGTVDGLADRASCRRRTGGRDAHRTGFPGNPLPASCTATTG